ncbi:hypothetical protein GCM10023205_30630 [Yinghuangia aomiensis]|uniref:Spore protein YkvP/CgeB glycosyl transferase-like domain-containing protein n=1 Tax=Yinghuangia aomiensis TaxID=676205 RepID=A0ABP9H908_9ACTN
MADTESVVTGTDAAEDTSTGRAAVAVGETAGGTAPEVVATENASSPSAVAAAKAKPRRSRKRVAPEEPSAAAEPADGTPDAAGVAAESGTPAPAKPRRTRKATADAEVPAPAKRAKRAPRKTAAAGPGEPGEPGEPKPTRRTPKAKVAEAPAAAAPTTDEAPEPTTSATRTGRRPGKRAPSKRKTAEAVAETVAAEGTTPAADATPGGDGAVSVLAGGPADAAGSSPVGSAPAAADGSPAEAAVPTGDTLTDEQAETTPRTADDRDRESADERAAADTEADAAHREAGAVVDALGEAADGADALGDSAGHAADARAAGAGVADHHDTKKPSVATSFLADAAVGPPGSGPEAPAETDPAGSESGGGVDALGDSAEPAFAHRVVPPSAAVVADLGAHDADTASDEDAATSSAPRAHDGSAAAPPTADATLRASGSTDPDDTSRALSDSAAAPDVAALPDAVPAAADFDLAADLAAATPPNDSTPGPADDLEALLPILDERPRARATRVDPTAVRPTLPRVLLTAETPLEPGSAPLEHSRALAERGNYVLLAVPAEAAEVSTSATAEGGGVLRVVNVPVDPETAADISLARADVAALEGGGFVTGIRRKFARRRLAQVRQGVWSAAAADPGWADRCADAYAPYRDAFAPQTEAHVADARSVEADPVTRTGTRLAVGPTNTAGQGREWARAVRTHIPGVGTETFALSSGNSFGYDADHAVSTDDWLSRTWQLRQLAYVLDNFSHVLAECAMPPFGRLNGPWANFDLAELDAAGIALALAFHGSEIRDPAAQRERVPFSPFDPDHELTRALQSKVDRLGPVVRDLDLPKFVSTPDLLHDVPGADWLPVVVDPGLWASDRVPLERDRPVVVHAPSSPFTKGTALIEPVVEELHDAGLIEYRRIKGVSHADMPAVLADADIVLDQFVFGAYGVMSVQALAAGRVTLCYLHESVTQYLPDGLPIVNADPDTLRDELERVVAERDAARRIAARGPAYVREHHDGTRSAEVLARFLGATPRAAQ